MLSTCQIVCPTKQERRKYPHEESAPPPNRQRPLVMLHHDLAKAALPFPKFLNASLAEFGKALSHLLWCSRTLGMAF